MSKSKHIRVKDESDEHHQKTKNVKNINKEKEKPSPYFDIEEEYYSKTCDEFMCDTDVEFKGNIPYCPSCGNKVQKV